MPDLPYTDADLRAEAARQADGLTEDPEFMSVGECMEDETIPSTGQTWAALDCEAYNQAQRAIHDLIGGAAALGAWAVELGADGLEPYDGVITLDGDDKPSARLHLAFAADMHEDDRAQFVMALGRVVLNNL